MKLEHRADVDKAYEEGYNLALEEGVEQSAPIRARLHQARYNIDLEVAGVPANNVLRMHMKISEDFEDTPAEEEVGNNDDAEVVGDPVDEAQN